MNELTAKQTQARERCRHCMALIDKKGVWWCDEGDCPIEDVAKCNEWEGEAGIISTQEAPHPNLILDLVNGGWTMKKVEHSLPPSMDLVVRVFKLFSPTRLCPIHGKARVRDRLFDKSRFVGVEGLSCGHTLLIHRRGNILKAPYSHTGRERSYIDNPRNWKFGGWQLVFKQTR